MATAAERFAAFALELELDAVPEEVVEAAKLHVLDVLGCGLAAHGLGIAGEGRQAMAELGGEPESSVIGLETGLPAPNAAFANAMLCHGLDFDDTHSDSVAARQHRGRPGGGRRRGGRRRRRARAACRDRRRQRDRHPDRHGDARGRSTGAGSTRRRSAGSSAQPPPPPGYAGCPVAETASAFGIAGSMASGLFAYLDDATATKPIHPAWAAHGALIAARLAVARRGGPARRAGGPLRPLPRVRRHAHRPRTAARRPRRALGDAEDRLQGVPGLPLHPRLARRDRVAPRLELDPDEIEDVSSPCPRRASRSCWSRPSRRCARAPTTRGSSRSSTRPRRCSSTAASAWPRTRRRPWPTSACSALARKVRYETSEYDVVPGRVPRRRADHAARRRTLEADLPYQLGAPENPMTADAGAGEVPRERRARGRIVRGLEEAVLDLESRDDLNAPSSRSSAARQSRYDGDRGAAEVVAAVREWVEREVYPAASDYEHADEYPEPLVEDMKRMGLFGVTIPRSTAASGSTCSPTC